MAMKRKPYAFFLLAAAWTASPSAFEIKPLGCGGATSPELRSEEIRFLPEDQGYAPCRKEIVQVDCRNAHAYLVEDMANQPIHEAITRKAYREVYRKPITTHNFLSPLIAGVLWNDDPQWLLRKAMHDKGQRQIRRFVDLMRRGESNPASPELTVRSHFGDLQFLHAMRSGDEDEAQARAKARAWVLAAHELASGRVKSTSRVRDTGFQAALGQVECGRRDSTACTIRDVLDAEGRFWKHVPAGTGELNIRYLAAGTILHVLQDVHSPSHGRLGPATEGKPSRESFTYSAENRKDHCNGDRATEVNRPMIDAALKDSVAYLNLFRNKASPEQVMQLLDAAGLPQLP